MNFAPLISVDELCAVLGAPDILIVDCRKSLSEPDAGRIAYQEAHIPGAVYADLDSDLSDLSKLGLGRHPLPEEKVFSRSLSSWGWTPETRVVAYDDANGALAAARLWWLLRLAGQLSVRVLDGGFSAWRELGQSIDNLFVERTPTSVSVSFDLQQLVDYTALQKGLDSLTLRLIDARGTARYRGEIEPIDRVAGHVPGALNRPYIDNLESDGRFKAPAKLREEFMHLLGAFEPASVVHMCGSGVTACHNLLAMESAGLIGSKVFAPSWSGWIGDATRPVAVGDASK